MNYPISLWWKLSLLGILTGMDFVLTWHLLHIKTGVILEGNPLAAWWLEHGGWSGLAGFKMATAGTAGGLALLIFRHRPRTGQRVLALACAALAAVVLYSGYLSATIQWGSDPQIRQLQASTAHLAAAQERVQAYVKIKFAMIRDVQANPCSLQEAVARLAATELANEPDWWKFSRNRFPEASHKEILAISIIREAVLTSKKYPGSFAWQLSYDLRKQFRALYHRALPDCSGRLRANSSFDPGHGGLGVPGCPGGSLGEIIFQSTQLQDELKMDRQQLDQLMAAFARSPRGAKRRDERALPQLQPQPGRVARADQKV